MPLLGNNQSEPFN